MAYNEILNLHYASFYEYGLRMFGSSSTELVEDTIQDFFVEIWTSRERLGEAKSIKAYLLSSFKRRLIKEKEKAKKFVANSDLSENYEFEVQFSVERKIIESETTSVNSKKLKILLNQLSGRQKEAIFLRFYQKMDYSDIAEVMKINNHSVVNLVSDGVRILKRHWFQTFYIILSLSNSLF